jgi:hypothetical protein
MDLAAPPHTSFGALARHCLGHAEWPEYCAIQQRSLAALFSKFDRGLELEWLHDRPDVVHVLALTLSCPAGAILRPLEAALQLHDTTIRRFRVPDTPAARPIALGEEPLPPGFPSALRQPAGWTRLVWRPASTRDVTLVRAWLEVGQRATVLDATQASVSSHGPRFVETQSAERFAEMSGQGWCVACPGSLEVPPGWTEISSPISPELSQISEWLLDRLPADSQLDPSVADEWLSDAVAEGFVDSFDAAVGLLSSLDEVGTLPATGSWGRLAEALVKRRVASASIADRDHALWLSNNALALPVGLMREMLDKGLQDWDAERSFEKWVALIPSEFQGHVNPQWARSLLNAAGAQIEEAQLRQLLARMPPGAYELVRAMEAAGLLIGVSQLRLAPRWLGLWAIQAAEDAVLNGPPEQWGEVLLNPHFASSLRQRLASELEGDSNRLLDSVLDADENETNPAHTIAVETLFELVGLACCMGEEFDQEQLLQLWLRQGQSVIELDDGRKLPRLLCSPEQAPHYGSWLLACWAISEQLEATPDVGVPNPWKLPGQLQAADLDAIATALRESDAASVRLGAVELFLRLLEAQDDLEPTTELDEHPLLAVPLALRAPSWARFRDLTPTQVEELVIAGRNVDELAENVWSCWLDEHCPAEPTLVHPKFSASHHFWRRVPVRVWEELFERDHVFLAELPYEHLSPRDFEQLLAAPARASRHAWRYESVALLPPELAVTAALRLAESAPIAVRALWRTSASSLLAAMEEAANAGRDERVSALLCNAYPESPNELFTIIRNRLALRGVADPVPRCARHWLQRLSTHSGERRLEAYELLADIEARLARAKHGGARGTSPRET